MKYANPAGLKAAYLFLRKKIYTSGQTLDAVLYYRVSILGNPLVPFLSVQEEIAMGSYVSLIIGCILVNNFVLTQILGICPFLGVSKSMKTASGMGGAVIFVMTIAGFVTACINKYLLVKYGVEYLQTIVFILVIAGLVQILEILLMKFSKPLYQALGIFLPLITTNCAVLGAAIICATKGYAPIKSTIYCAASAAGFALALILFSSIRERLELARPPRALKGIPLTLITAGLLAMVFMGFSGLGSN